MTTNFNAKNLSYEAKEPAFLRRLRNEHGGGDSSRHERPQARPRKQVKDGDDDDQPTYVVEGSQDVLSKAEYEALTKQDELEKEVGKDQPASSDAAASGGTEEIIQSFPTQHEPIEQKSAAIGSSKRKRAAKIFGDKDQDSTVAAETGPVKPEKMPKVKKGKKIKLSFDTEEREP